MRGLWIEKGDLSLRDDLVLEPKDEEVRVAVELSGVCGTDLELLRGYYDFRGVPGHEFVGTVRSEGEWQGQRVVADINFGCGDCEFCARELPHHCLYRRTLGINQASGAFAEEISVPAQNLVAVPEGVPPEHAVFAEPLAAALQILEQVELSQRRILLVGAGRLGRMIAWVINKLEPSAELHVLLRNPSRRQQLPEQCQFRSEADLARIYDVAIDSSGHPEGFAQALDHLKAKGVMVVKSTYAAALTLDMSRVVVDEISLIGSRCGPMTKAMAFLQQHPEVFASMRNETVALTDFQRAFQLAGNPEIDKVLFQF